ncbi:MAG TPA: hypothetical protein VLB09_05295 [Nitrospiria bacterium]|nr:hypothetical protein [Nitrospiria bacterium]
MNAALWFRLGLFIDSPPVWVFLSTGGRIPAQNITRLLAPFSGATAANLVPEIDQLKLGSYLFPHLDPYIDQKQGKRIRNLFLDIYREMEKDAAFVEAGSALGMCYADLFAGRRPALHFYQYVPRHLGKKAYPVLVFLHGSLGNFKGYSWVLKDLADAEGYAILAPTYGSGNWHLDRDGAILTAVYNHCVEDAALDHRTIYLAGLSNGGLGVSREMQRAAGRYAGFAFISPVMEAHLISTVSALDSMKGKTVLILHGEKDRRIPVAAIRTCEGILKNAGLPTTAHYEPNEDHFLFFAQRDAVLQNIAAWLRENGN